LVALADELGDALLDQRTPLGRVVEPRVDRPVAGEMPHGRDATTPGPAVPSAGGTRPPAPVALVAWPRCRTTPPLPPPRLLLPLPPPHRAAPRGRGGAPRRRTPCRSSSS